MIIQRFVQGAYQANNYLITDEESGESVLIDCSDKIPEIDESVNLKYILLTHGHFDHVLGVNHYDAPVLIHKKDVLQLKSTNAVLLMYGLPTGETPRHDGFVKDGDELFIGNTKIKVIHTPGHTKGCVCYLIDGKLFSGDTLFLETVGRTDLPGGNFKKLENSVKNILFQLDDSTVVYPGHGAETTIGHEKLHNEVL